MTDAFDNPHGELAFDTDRHYLGEVYAKALLGAAGDDAGEVVEQLESLAKDVLVRNPKLLAVLSSPKVPFGEKEALLDKAFGSSGAGMHPLLLKFLKVSIRRGRGDCLRQIALAAREHLNVVQGRVRVRVKTAAPIDEGVRNDIVSKLQTSLGASVEMDTEVDPSILGGLVVRVGDTVYDGSVAHRLRQMRGQALVSALEAFRGQMGQFVSDNGA